MIIAKKYKQVLTTDKRNVVLKSGRTAGKSKFMAQYVVINFFKYDADILVTRAYIADMEKSMFQEILDVLEEEELIQYTIQRTRPLKIKNIKNGNTIYFEGIGGADKSRTRGFKPRKKLSLIIVDEMQQLPEQTNLKQALATFRRHYQDYAKVIMAFNPEPQNSHWANEYYRINESESNIHLCLHTTYRHIIKFLNDADKEEIDLMATINPDEYRHMYLGETNGLFGGVYYTFNREAHLIDKDIVKDMIKRVGVLQMLVGIDSAVTRDRTAAVPVLVLRNGQCIVTEYYYHDPMKNGAMPDEELKDYLFNFIEEMRDEYDLRSGNKPIHLVVDSANANLVKTLEYHNKYGYRIWSYSQKKIIEMARIVQDAFSTNTTFILDNGGIMNYKTGRFEHQHPLVTALESVTWDKAGKGFDPLVPNDSTDALTYALATYFKNPHNLNFPKRYGYYELPKELKERKKEEDNSSE